MQVKLLVKYAAQEPRWIIRTGALSGLYTLAKHGSHYWSDDAISDLIIVAGSTDSEKLMEYIFDILIILTKSAAVCQMYYRLGLYFFSIIFHFLFFFLINFFNVDIF